MFFFVAIFVFVIGSILFNIGKGVSEWADNNAQPERCNDAEIVSKRTEVSGGERSTSTTYYATFELPGSERKELKISGRDYGQFAEGDWGRLRHQGTRYLGFDRQPRSVKPPLVSRTDAPDNLLCTYCGSAIPAGKVKCDGCGWTWRPGKPEEADVSG